MAKDGLKVMDSDMHIVEPANLWERYIDSAFKDRAPQGLRRHPRDLGVQVGKSIFPLPTRSYANAIAPLMTVTFPAYCRSFYPIKCRMPSASQGDISPQKTSLSSGELCQKAEEMAEKQGVLISQNTIRNNQTFSSLASRYDK